MIDAVATKGAKRPDATAVLDARPEVRAVSAGEAAALHALAGQWAPAINADAASFVTAAQEGMLWVAEVAQGSASGVEMVAVAWCTSSGPPPDAVVMILGVAVAPAWRRRGVGTAMLAALAATMRPCRLVATCTVADAPAAGLLCRAGFGGTFVGDYEAPGQDCLYFEHGAEQAYEKHTNTVLVPASNPAGVRATLDSGDRRLVRVRSLSHGTHYEVVTVTEVDDSSVMANEVSVGVGFAGALLAALAFLFGFVLASQKAPSDVLGLIGSCVAITTLSLVAYANGSGELSRLRSGEFERTNVVGNILSEFAGVYPIFIVTPAVVIAATNASPASIILSVTSGLALLLYMTLRLDLVRRYMRNNRVWWNLYRATVALLPLLAALCWRRYGVLWPWTVATTALLFGGAVACLRVGSESLTPAD